MNALAKIQNLTNALGPSQQEKPVTIGQVKDKDGNVTSPGVTEKFWFRRLPFLIADEIRVRALGPDGKFSAALFAGNNARIVAAALINDDGSQVAPYETVCGWDPVLVDALAAVANDMNNMEPKALEVVEGNSAETPAVVSS